MLLRAVRTPAGGLPAHQCITQVSENEVTKAVVGCFRVESKNGIIRHSMMKHNNTATDLDIIWELNISAGYCSA